MIKELLSKYKNLKKETVVIKEYAIPKVETEKIEREFPIEVIASVFENRLFVPLEEIEDFASFITNENVNLSNIQRFLPTIQSEILKQYPNLNVLCFTNHELCLGSSRIEWTREWYKKYNEDTLVVKSLKKGYIKTMQDK